MRLWDSRVTGAMLLSLLTLGCMHDLSATATSSEIGKLSYALVGDDTGISLDFNIHPSVVIAHDLQGDDLCYLAADDAVIVCTQGGSYLIFGPDDGMPLVKDNPVGRLHPARSAGAMSEMQRMQAFGTIFLIAGSIDRIPDALSAYLSDPGPHRRQALALARSILLHDSVEWVGAARGGTFLVSLRLTESGREKLEEAELSDDNKSGIYAVKMRFKRHVSATAQAKTRSTE